MHLMATPQVIYCCISYLWSTPLFCFAKLLVSHGSTLAFVDNFPTAYTCIYIYNMYIMPICKNPRNPTIVDFMSLLNPNFNIPRSHGPSTASTIAYSFRRSLALPRSISWPSSSPRRPDAGSLGLQKRGLWGTECGHGNTYQHPVWFFDMLWSFKMFQRHPAIFSLFCFLKECPNGQRDGCSGSDSICWRQVHQQHPLLPRLPWCVLWKPYRIGTKKYFTEVENRPPTLLLQSLTLLLCLERWA